jgi:hypothetical protein
MGQMGGGQNGGQIGGYNQFGGFNGNPGMGPSGGGGHSPNGLQKDNRVLVGGLGDMVGMLHLNTNNTGAAKPKSRAQAQPAMGPSLL